MKVIICKKLGFLLILECDHIKDSGFLHKFLMFFIHPIKESKFDSINWYDID